MNVLSEFVDFLGRIPGESIFFLIGFIALCALVAMIMGRPSR